MEEAVLLADLEVILSVVGDTVILRSAFQWRIIMSFSVTIATGFYENRWQADKFTNKLCPGNINHVLKMQAHAEVAEERNINQIL